MTFLDKLLSKKSALPFAHISLVFAGLMWVLPFLNYYHAYPLTTFYQEWSAAMLGLAAMLLLLSGEYWRNAEIPRIVLLPVAMMMLVVVQFALGKLPYFGQALLYTLYMMWAALLIMLGGRLREELGLPAVATVLAVFLLLGAELNAFLGMYQHFHWHTFLDRVVTMKVGAGVFGNIAQPNHYSDYLTLGLASLGLLYARRALRSWQAALLALPILFVLPLSGSRGTWIYLLWLVVSAFMWQYRNSAQRPLFYYSLLALLGFGLMHLVVQLPWLAVDSGSVNSVQRMFNEDVSSGSIRLHLWHEAWIMFTHFPLLGAGFGQFAWQHFQLSSTMHYTGIVGLYNNAHNLVMQLGAEGGLVGLLVLFGAMLPWLWQAFRAERSIYHWWGYALLAVLATHSMLEYPLWYAYFMGIAALVLGLLDTARYRLELSVLGRVSVLFTLLLGAFSLQQLMVGYRSIENLTVLRPESGNNVGYIERMNAGIAVIQKQALLQPYADLFTSSMIDIDPVNLPGKLALNGKVERFVPIAAAVYRQSLLLAQNGQMAEAEAQMEQGIWSYPGDFPMAEDLLHRLVLKDPEHFSALLEFALKKHEEYQSAVHTK